MTFQSKVGLNFWNHFWPMKSAGGPHRAPENLKKSHFSGTEIFEKEHFFASNPQKIINIDI